MVFIRFSLFRCYISLPYLSAIVSSYYPAFYFFRSS
jgi:hypothetical protein